MSQTLQYLDGLLLAAADNISQLITAEVLRDYMVSAAQGAGFVADTTQITVPINPDIPVSVNPLLLGAESVGAGWDTDGNNYLFPNYTIGDTVVPAGYSKVVSFVAVLSMAKQQAGVDEYDLYFTQDGVEVGVRETISFDGSEPQVVTVIANRIVDISTNPLFGVSILGVATGDDLTLYSFEMQVGDRMLWVGP